MTYYTQNDFYHSPSHEDGEYTINPVYQHGGTDFLGFAIEQDDDDNWSFDFNATHVGDDGITYGGSTTATDIIRTKLKELIHDAPAFTKQPTNTNELPRWANNTVHKIDNVYSYVYAKHARFVVNTATRQTYEEHYMLDGDTVVWFPLINQPAEVRNMTPELSITDPWDVAKRAMKAINRIILFGPPGTGKTFFGLTERDAEQPAWRIICSDDMTTAQVEGCWMPAADNTWTWKEGPAVLAWRHGGRLVIDEIDKAGGDVMSMLLAFTDSAQSAKWTNPETGDNVEPHPDFSVVMTTNLENMSELPGALKDRFPVAIRIPEPHPAALAQLPEHFREPARTLADADPKRRASIRAFQALTTLLEQGWDLDQATSIVLPNIAEEIRDAMKINNGPKA